MNDRCMNWLMKAAWTAWIAGMVLMLLVAIAKIAKADTIDGTYDVAGDWVTALGATGELGEVLVLDFAGMGSGEVLSTQFAADGVTFIGEAEVVITSDFNDGAGISGGGLGLRVKLITDQPMIGFAVIYKGAARIVSGNEVGGPFTFVGQPCGSISQPNFVGFCGVTFATPTRYVEAYDWADDLLRFDDVYIAWQDTEVIQPGVRICVTEDGLPATGLAWTWGVAPGFAELDEAGCRELTPTGPGTYGGLLFGMEVGP